MRHSIIVTAAERRPLRRCSGILREKTGDWVYLGQSIEEDRMAQRYLGNHLNRRETADDFHSVARSLRDTYLTYVYEIGRIQQKLLWWLSSVSYRRREVSKTFAQVCNLKVAVDLVCQYQGIDDTLVLAISDRTVRRALARNLPSDIRKEIVYIGSTKAPAWSPLLDIGNLFCRRIFFVLREGRRILTARRLGLRPFVPKEPTTVIVSSVSHRNIQRAADYHTFFFGNLAHKLNSDDKYVATMPLVLRTVSYSDVLNKLKDSQFPVMIPHSYLRTWDIFQSAIASVARPPRPKPAPLLEGMDISPILEEDLRSHWISNRAADVLILVAVLRRWKHMGAAIERIIYIFENQPWERGICWEAKRSLPYTHLVGYQHSRAPKMLLSYYLAEGGEPEAPLPHRVVSVGKHTADLLSHGGFSGHDIRVGGAFQMTELFELKSNRNTNTTKPTKPTVLVACSEGIEETVELAGLAIRMYRDNQGIEIIIKFHPVTPYSQVQEMLGDHLPCHVSVSDEPIINLIKHSSVMLYTGSTVCVQALALGLPVVHFRPKYEFDLDPLEDIPEARLEASSPSELKNQVEWLLDNREDYVAEHRDKWDELVDNMYSPVTEASYAAFVD